MFSIPVRKPKLPVRERNWNHSLILFQFQVIEDRLRYFWNITFRSMISPKSAFHMKIIIQHIVIKTKSAFHHQELNSRMGSTFDICLQRFQGITGYFKIWLFRTFFAFNFAAVNKFTPTINPLVTLHFFNSQVTTLFTEKTDRTDRFCTIVSAFQGNPGCRFVRKSQGSCRDKLAFGHSLRPLCRIDPEVARARAALAEKNGIFPSASMRQLQKAPVLSSKILHRIRLWDFRTYKMLRRLFEQPVGHKENNLLRSELPVLPLSAREIEDELKFSPKKHTGDREGWEGQEKRERMKTSLSIVTLWWPKKMLRRIVIWNLSFVRPSSSQVHIPGAGGRLLHKKDAGAGRKFWKEPPRGAEILFCGRILKLFHPQEVTILKRHQIFLGYFFRLKTEAPAVDLSRLNTPRRTKAAFLTPKRYEKHLRRSYMGAPEVHIQRQYTQKHTY